MRRGWIWLVLCIVAASPFVSATEGMFQGRLVDPPDKEKAVQGWIFVQGRNRLVRRVDVSRAVIVLAPKNSSQGGKKCDSDCLSVGQEVRVTAEQDASGEWRARRVEILEDGPAKRQTSHVHTASRLIVLPSQPSLFTKLNYLLTGVAG